MRWLLSILLIVLFSLAAEYFLPWWTLAVVCFFVALFLNLKPGKAFLSGFLGILLLWFFVAFIKDEANAHILSERMAKLFQLPGSWVFLFVAAVIGGIVGGLSAWSGALLRRAYQN